MITISMIDCRIRLSSFTMYVVAPW